MTWEILEETKHSFGTNRRRAYKVQCKCGYIGIRRADHVDQGRSSCCKPCSSVQTAEHHPPPTNYRGCGDLSKTFFSHIVHGAHRRNLDFNVSIEFLWRLFLSQNKQCVYTGRLLTMVPNSHQSNVDWNATTASLDRISSDKGYTEGNVQWVHKEVNRFKNNLVHQEFLKLCSEITDYHK